MMTMNKERTYKLGPILLEMLLIFFGLYFAMLFTNMNEESKREDTKILHMKNILTEIELNIQSLIPAQEYHQIISDTLQIVFKNMTDKEATRSFGPHTFRSMKFWQGTKTPSLRISAYEASINSGVMSDFDIDVLNRISEAYSYIADYKSYTSTYFQGFIALNSQNNQYDVLYMMMLFSNDAKGIEYMILEQLKNTKADLEKHLESIEADS